MSLIAHSEKTAGLRRRFLERVVGPALALASARSPTVAQTFRVAGCVIRVEYAGRALAERLGRAFSHAALSGDATPDLVIHAWDSASNALPPPAHSLPVQDAADLVEGGEESGLLAGFVSKEETLNLIDLERGHAYFWLPSLDAMPGWVPAAPFRRILQWFLATRNVHLVHGAAIGRPAGALLVTARGGSGKSSTALAAAAHGLSYLGDDYVAISEGTPPELHCLYNSAKLTDASLARQSFYRAFVRERDVGDRLKSVLFMAEAMPEVIIPAAPLIGIAVPVIDHAGRTRFERLDARGAFLALAPSSMLHVSLQGGPQLMRALRHLVGTAPCYRLMLGREPAEIADAIAAFVDGRGA
ncbi:hypothetical protein OSH08_16155 [Kaistia geumhonensis]|uniref:Serine kinase n=1 Tax=Kaistia geumhonensis TaxID=410839 RepID=A0ABU0M9W7_9HYPH|nr:hypothetical protein [Kaistia geumhonensis]MCX5480536.1 hypothetical protein [Kaistia geumhonensis]MDQ0517762.1 hypothetical protein [Kaistia geumhonensis]